jgi:hypothetical protein
MSYEGRNRKKGEDNRDSMNIMNCQGWQIITVGTSIG